jgi:hypothetical protein
MNRIAVHARESESAKRTVSQTDREAKYSGDGSIVMFYQNKT